MSNSQMHGVAGYPAGAGVCTMDMDWSAEIQRKRDALRAYLAVLEEARRRLDEIQHDTAGGTAAAADESFDTPSDDDDFYPLGDDEEEAAEEERPMQWQDQVCRQMVHNAGHHLRHADEDGDEISRDIVALGLHVPHIIQSGNTTPPLDVPAAGEDEALAADGDGRGGFGAVPASAAAIAGLEKHRYDGPSSSGGGGGSTCVICMQDYRKGRRLRVMPCAYKHRFHGRCIREWLSVSNMCPLCRHALPTAADAERGGEGGGGVRRRGRVLVRVNVNPY